MELPDLPKVKASYILQRGFPVLQIRKWPEGISEILISRPGLEVYRLTHDEYNRNRFHFGSLKEAVTADFQAVRRLGEHSEFGPKTSINSPKVRQILYVAIERRRTSFLGIPRWGMTVSIENNIPMPLPPFIIQIEKNWNLDRSFFIPVKGINSGEFYPFPKDWMIAKGEFVTVAVDDECMKNDFSIYYRTSREIS